SGFVNGDAPSSLRGSLSFATTADATSQVGLYPVTPLGLVSRNYTITYVPGALTIFPAPGGSATGSSGSESSSSTGGTTNASGSSTASSGARSAASAPLTPIPMDHAIVSSANPLLPTALPRWDRSTEGGSVSRERVGANAGVPTLALSFFVSPRHSSLPL